MGISVKFDSMNSIKTIDQNNWLVDYGRAAEINWEDILTLQIKCSFIIVLGTMSSGYKSVKT